MNNTIVFLANERKRLVEEEITYRDLLLRAADAIQSYCANENGDMNDSLAMEIYQVLGIR